MRRLAFALVPLLLGGFTQLRAEASVVWTIDAPDLGPVRAHWRQSPFGALAADPALAALRDQVGAWLTVQSGVVGLPLADLAGDAVALRAQVLAEPAAPHCAYRIAIRCPTRAADSWHELLAERGAGTQKLWGPLVLGHDGSWLCAAREVQPTLPHGVAAAAAPGDLHYSVDLSGLCRALNLTTWERVLELLDIRGLDGHSTFSSTGSDDAGTVVGLHLPLQPLAPSALAYLPASAVLVAAVGLDGPALAKTWTHLGEQDQDLKTSLDAWNDAFTNATAGDWPTVLASLQGTLVVAITRGVPFPSVTVVLPASVFVDAALDHFAQSLAKDLAPARTQPLALAVPGYPVIIEARRFDHEWVLTTDPTVLAPELDPGPRLNLADAIRGLVGAADRPCALVMQDNRQLQAELGSLLPMSRPYLVAALGDLPEWLPLDRLLAFGTACLTTIGPRLPPSTTVLMQDGGGGRFAAVNGISQGGLLGLTLVALSHAIVQMQNDSRMAASADQENLLISRCRDFANEHNGVFPGSLEQVCGESGAAKATLVRPPDAGPAGRAYLYVRPIANSTTPQQPVILEDPSYNDGRGLEVAYADGHIDYQQGTALWLMGLRLSRLPDAPTSGISPALWGIHVPPPGDPAKPSPDDDK